jgi:hypothetical protein
MASVWRARQLKATELVATSLLNPITTQTAVLLLLLRCCLPAQHWVPAFLREPILGLKYGVISGS